MSHEYKICAISIIHLILYENQNFKFNESYKNLLLSLMLQFTLNLVIVLTEALFLNSFSKFVTLH